MDGLVDVFHFDTFTAGQHTEVRGSSNMRLLFLIDGGRTSKPQYGFELKLPMTPEALADIFEASAKELRSMK